jgi:sulfite reductase (NADPH) flavoprotein alpha-component
MLIMNTPATEKLALALAEDRTSQIHEAVSGLSTKQLHWVSGYIAGLAASTSDTNAVEADLASSLTVLYGSQTGNGEQIARALADNARDRGYAVTIASLADFKPQKLRQEKRVAFIISTHGEGDPPDDAELFHEFILSKRAPDLAELQYSVLALGDSSYVNFCRTGRELDARLAELGATPLAPIVECDLDYDETAQSWADRIIGGLAEIAKPDRPKPQLRAVETVSAYDKHNPFHAEVLVNQRITGARSTKDVRHIELSLQDSGIQYEPGDALAIIGDNPPQLVTEILDLLALSADTPVLVQDDSVTLHDALHRHLEITLLNRAFLTSWAARSGATKLQSLLRPGQEAELTTLFATHQIIDIIRRFPTNVDAAEFVGMLRKLSPRSYSIASSSRANPDEVHITVAALRYMAFDNEHYGAASTFLADRIAIGDTIPVYIESNTRFRLPDDPTPIIMIGPGTGVAPFRAFIEERVERGASGKNWLIFGDRNFSSDFLYQLEWQRYLKQGHLARLDVAFSRDQQEKHYVQNRIAEHGSEMYQWLQQGAVIYVCGDAKRMAPGVHQALIDVLVDHGGLTASTAEAKLKDLRRERRYQRDVY